jgi:hypothetical protein
MTPSAGEIRQTAMARLALLIEEFGEHYIAKSNVTDGSVLDTLESDWEKLCKQTEDVYREMVSKLVSSTDEKAIIAKKKQSGANSESS